MYSEVPQSSTSTGSSTGAMDWYRYIYVYTEVNLDCSLIRLYSVLRKLLGGPASKVPKLPPQRTA